MKLNESAKIKFDIAQLSINGLNIQIWIC